MLDSPSVELRRITELAWLRERARQWGTRTAGWLPTRSMRLALLCATLSSVAFLIDTPHVGDLWAALAREQSARAGVGLSYWFGWYAGGSTPGSYSLLTPTLSALMGAKVLLAIATVALVPLVAVAARGTTHPNLAVWTCALIGAANLWDGRVPYTLGAALGVGAIIALRARRPVIAGICGIATVCFSPIAGVFLGLATVATLLAIRHLRVASLICAALTGAALIGLSAWFGIPGPQGFTWTGVAMSAGLLLALLYIRPARPVAVAALITLAALPALWLIPSGMGANIMRLIYTALPIAVAATARTRTRKLALVGLAPAIIYCLCATVSDLYIASSPVSQPGTYAGLKAELTKLPDLRNRRLEYVKDGTHAAAAVLVQVAPLARGYETQTENQIDAVLYSSALNAASYQQWLADNAVGYVVIARHAISASREWHLVGEHTPGYLTRVWQDDNFVLYRVRNATTIVPPPAELVSSDQARMTISVSRPVTVVLRLRWSRLLTALKEPAPDAAQLTATDDGWTAFHAAVAGTYSIGGS